MTMCGASLVHLWSGESLVVVPACEIKVGDMLSHAFDHHLVRVTHVEVRNMNAVCLLHRYFGLRATGGLMVVANRSLQPLGGLSEPSWELCTSLVTLFFESTTFVRVDGVVCACPATPARSKVCVRLCGL